MRFLEPFRRQSRPLPPRHCTAYRYICLLLEDGAIEDCAQAFCVDQDVIRQVWKDHHLYEYLTDEPDEDFELDLIDGFVRRYGPPGCESFTMASWEDGSFTPSPSSTSTSSTVSTLASTASPIADGVAAADDPDSPVSSYKNLSLKHRNAVLHYLLGRCNGNGRIEMGGRKDAAAKFNCSLSTVSRIWKRFQDSVDHNGYGGDVSAKRRGCCGRNHVRSVADEVRKVPIDDRTSLRALAASTGIPMTTLHRLVKKDDMKKATSHLKPMMKEKQRKARVEFALSHIKQSGLFDPMFNIVHIDEKQFQLKKIQQKYYLLPGEVAPHRTVCHKGYMTQVMFVCAVARPRYDPQTKTWFDGKLGIWPYVHKEPAKRTSKNRPKGTLVTKTRAVNAESHRDMVINKILPAIKSKWPRSYRKQPIYIQEDNAPAHSVAVRRAVAEAGAEDGWDISVKPQPAQSPDMNILDLGFFNSIQSLQYQKKPHDIDSLIHCVEEAFNELHRDTLEDVFLSLQQAMMCVLQHDGLNNYRLSHMGKQKLRKNGKLPVTLRCPRDLIEQGQDYLDDL